MEYHIKCEKLPRYALLPGDPGRAEEMSEFLNNRECVAKNREFWTFTGDYKGVELAITSTGIGSPSTAIALEELARCGVRVFIRTGTCGALKEAKLGDLAVLRGAIRDEGTSAGYVGKNYPAVASAEVTLALLSACDSLNYGCFAAISECSDALYATDPYLPMKTESMRELNGAQVAEMESSVLFVLSSLYGLKAGAICSVVNHVYEKTGNFVYDRSHIERMTRAALESVAILEKWRRGKRIEVNLDESLLP